LDIGKRLAEKALTHGAEALRHIGDIIAVHRCFQLRVFQTPLIQESFYLIKDGRIVEEWMMFDELSIFKQVWLARVASQA